MSSFPVLHTLGYEKRSLEEFLQLLQSSKIDVLVDVRDVAWSHKKGFAKKALSQAAEGAGLEYVHAQFAGNPKRLREAGAGLEELLEAYARHLDSNPELLERFGALVGGYLRRRKRVCLMCFERDPAECHRSVLADRWRRETRGSVAHLGTEAAPEPPKSDSKPRRS